ncbi:MAG: hypothetical protein RRY34_09545 [Victivallaceae bacterium]
MRYFYMEDGFLTEYLGMVKSTAEMSGYATYDGTRSADWLKLDEEGKIVELTTSEYEAAHPFDPTKYTFSKYKVKAALQAISTAEGENLWQSVKSGLSADQYEDMMLAQDFNLADEAFSAFYDQLTAAGVDVDAILKESVL